MQLFLDGTSLVAFFPQAQVHPWLFLITPEINPKLCFRIMTQEQRQRDRERESRREDSGQTQCVSSCQRSQVYEECDLKGTMRQLAVEPPCRPATSSHPHRHAHTQKRETTPRHSAVTPPEIAWHRLMRASTAASQRDRSQRDLVWIADAVRFNPHANLNLKKL